MRAWAYLYDRKEHLGEPPQSRYQHLAAKALPAFHAVLEREFRPLQVGDVVLVRYEGVKEGRDRSYKSYRVLVDRIARASALIPPEAPAPLICEACGLVEPEHADGCPNDIPF
jgi:hypothetical protein